jgi:hypothetical protein
LRLENNDDTRLINKLGPDGFPLLGVVDGCDVDMFSTAGGNDVEGGRDGQRHSRSERTATIEKSHGCIDCKQPAAEERTNAETCRGAQLLSSESSFT